MFSLYQKTHAWVTADNIGFYRQLNSPAWSSKSGCQYILSAYCLNVKSTHPMKKNLMYLWDQTNPLPEGARI